MPTFKLHKKPAHVWIPLGRLVHMESGDGGLVTVLRAILVTPAGSEGLATFEVEGRCDVLGAALDAGKPTEVGQ